MDSVSVDAIQNWLTTQLAEQLGIDAQDMNIWRPLTEYGLDSITGVSLAGDLEDWLGLQLSPTLLWDHTTIEALAWYLAEEANRGAAGGKDATRPGRVHPEGVIIGRNYAAQLLAKLDEFSDADVDALLGSLVAA